MNIKLISNTYQVRQLVETHIPDIYKLCCANSLYYAYCPPFVTGEHIKEDMVALPTRITMEDK